MTGMPASPSASTPRTRPFFPRPPVRKAGAFCAWGPARDAGGAAQRGAGPFEGWYKALEDRIWLTQLGLNILLPLVLCLGAAGGPVWILTAALRLHFIDL